MVENDEITMPMDELEMDVQADEERPRGSRANARIQDLVNQIKELRAENEQLRFSQSLLDSEDDSEELEDLLEDEDGNLLYKGAYVPKDLAQELRDLKDAVNDVRAWRDQYETGQWESDFDSRFQQAHSELSDAVASVVSEVREENLPGLSKEQAAQADEYIFMLTDRFIGQALQLEDGDLTPEVIEASVALAMRRAKELFGAFGEAQIRSNAAYGARYKAKSTGTPGSPQLKTLGQMSKAERRASAAKAAQIAEQMRSR